MWLDIWIVKKFLILGEKGSFCIDFKKNFLVLVKLLVRKRRFWEEVPRDGVLEP